MWKNVVYKYQAHYWLKVCYLGSLLKAHNPVNSLLLIQINIHQRIL